MPPNHLETRMDAGDAAVSHAPKSPTRRGISDAALRAAKPTSKPYKLFAGNGLYLEVKPNGAKHWRWKYRLLGKENRVALGSYPKLPLREAREAMEAARKLVEQGKHLIPESLFRDRRPYVRCRQQQIKCHTDKPRQNICCKEPPDKFFLSACGNQIIYNPDQITAKINHDRPRDHRDLLVQHRFYVVMFPRTGKRPRSKISDKIRCQRQN